MNKPVDSAPRSGRSRPALINSVVALAAMVLVLVLAEPVLRLRYAEPERPVPPVVREVMPLLRANDHVGFTWEPNVPAERNIIFNNADIAYEPLTTDEFGIWNAPEAIARRSAGDAVQVVGLGDSFMEMAAPIFHRTFAKRDRFYYSLAIHRQAPPQYLGWLQEPGVNMKPDIVILGLFENDFFETEDFDAWAASGMDWFAYHSGTWFGPPPIANPLRRFVDEWLQGYSGLANVIRVRLRGERMSVVGPDQRQIDRVNAYLAETAALAREAGANLWLVLIPSKPTARGETTPEAEAFDSVLGVIEPELAGVIDLRPVFQTHPDPESLYYREDGHWNNAGIALAAETILDRIDTIPTELEYTQDNESRSH